MTQGKPNAMALGVAVGVVAGALVGAGAAHGPRRKAG